MRILWRNSFVNLRYISDDEKAGLFLLLSYFKEENDRLKLLIDTGKFNLQLDIQPGMSTQDIELMRKDIEEGILSQIQVNQLILQDSKTTWNLKVNYNSYILKYNIRN